MIIESTIGTGFKFWIGKTLAELAIALGVPLLIVVGVFILMGIAGIIDGIEGIIDGIEVKKRKKDSKAKKDREL